MTAEVITVGLGARAYEVRCGSGLLAAAGTICKPFTKTGRVFLVTDTNVGPLWGAKALAALQAEGLDAIPLEVAAGEETKSWEGLAGLCDALAIERAERGDLLVALGGGVIGDLVGFAAGIFKRGMDFVQVPTTLLAQVDSSVGGKTAIDIAAGKNLVGLFHQPKAVIVDFDVLETLPPREMRAGFAEVIKYGLINDPAFFAWLRANGQAVLTKEPNAVFTAVTTSIRAKAAIVEADERETTGARALLNLGHTFGHGFEVLAGFDGKLLHGEAVATGMAVAFGYSAALGLCPPHEAEEAIRALKAAGFETNPQRLPGAPFDAGALVEAMAQDKKASGGKLSLVLAEGIGKAKLVTGLDLNPVRAYLDGVLREG